MEADEIRVSSSIIRQVLNKGRVVTLPPTTQWRVKNQEGQSVGRSRGPTPTETAHPLGPGMLSQEG